VHTRFWWVDLRGGVFMEGVGVDGRIILKWRFYFGMWDNVAACVSSVCRP
jgi:hypothetical protein